MAGVKDYYHLNKELSFYLHLVVYYGANLYIYYLSLCCLTFSVCGSPNKNNSSLAN